MTTNGLLAEWPAPPNIFAGCTLRDGDLADLAVPGEPCWLNQVHGTKVVMAARYDTPPDADASVGRQAGDLCVIKTADCLPVLFCSADGHDIAAAHAGWRGLVAGVLENTVANIGRDPKQLMAWFGPAISQPSFEVGDEVRDAFVAVDPDSKSCFEMNDRGRWRADLYGLAEQRLRVAGVTSIFGGGLCTYTDSARFYSFRRDADCGRMVSFVTRLT